jgi:hypothetical protein
MVVRIAGMLGPIAAALVLMGCEVAPHGAASADQARRDFSSAEFCPMDRVGAARLSPMPQAPPPIARDPERMAMWREKFEGHIDPKARQTIAVEGCGERATFACWDWVGDEPGRRGRKRRVYIGTSCLEADTASRK